MKTYILCLVAPLTALFLLSACGPKYDGMLAAYDTAKHPRTFYVWDADGHTELALLRGLKAEAASRLRQGGCTVSDDPNATDAYVKITVDDAVPGDGGLIKARLYIIDAADQAVIYDKTCEVGSESEGYPIAVFVRCALEEFTCGKVGTGGEE